MAPLRSHDPDHYVARGYAYLLTALAARLVHGGSNVDGPLRIWLATTMFRTAKLLALGRDPWAPLAAGEKLLPLDAD